ncbi:MAG: transposase family protein [Gammaproteobacteria bacterium]|nr:transposase family protein [Gammaproteobacteria bacterium]
MPFCGIPKFLICDKGSANLSYPIQNLLKEPGVKQLPHAAKNPKGKGQVENANNLAERSFEGKLNMMDIKNIEHLNAEAFRWMLWYNSMRKHRRYKHARFAMWQTIRKE